MRESRRHDLLLLAAFSIIVGALALYASLISRWLSKPAAPPPAVAAAPKPTADPRRLETARARFRENFLDPAASIELAEALFEAGRPVDAFYALFSARELFGEEAFRRAHAFVVQHKGRHFLRGEPFAATAAQERVLRARLENDPANPDIHHYLARVAASQGRAADALKQVEQGLAGRADDPGLLAFKAELSLPADPLGAITIFARLVHAKPDSPEAKLALETLGRLAQIPEEGAAGESSRFAREGLEELAKAHPKDPLVFSTLAMALWGRGELNAVRALVAEKLAKDPRHAGAASIEGSLALNDRDVEKALRRFNDAWEANSDDLYAASKLAELYAKQRADAEAALPYYLALYRRNPFYDDGEPAERLIRRALDERRHALLKPVTAEGLGRYLKSEDASLRAEACVRAAQLKDPRWLESLAELLDDDAEIVRHNADYALFQLSKQFPDALRVRRDEWLSAARPLMRVRALNLFADIDRKETFPLVARALYDPNPAVRYLTKTMVLDRYYSDLPAARKASADYLAQERHPAVLALYDRAKRAAGEL